jgi:hypothetical protein
MDRGPKQGHDQKKSQKGSDERGHPDVMTQAGQSSNTRPIDPVPVTTACQAAARFAKALLPDLTPASPPSCQTAQSSGNTVIASMPPHI